MTLKSFSVTLIVLTALVTAVLFSFSYLDLLKQYADLSWISLLFFIIFSLIVYKGAEMSSKSENKQLFGQFFLLATGIKMMVSLSIVLVYFFMAKPADQYFIIPFFFVYLCYTVFEVYFMTKLGNSR